MPDKVAHAYNFSTQDAEAGKLLQVQGQTYPHSEKLSKTNNM